MGVIRRVEVPAPSLRGNLVGDPAARRASIYLPERYFTHPRQRFPVIYLLHGFAADDRAFIAGAYQNLNVRVSMDSLIAAGKVEPMIVVTPNARNRFDGSFYVNSVTTGRWEDFIVKDLVGYVDRHFRTIRSASGRGLAGHSMGGYGALYVGMRNPAVFSAIYALSPCCLSNSLLEPSGSMRTAWRRALSVNDTSQIKAAGFFPNILMALTAAYSPAPNHPPLHIEFPIAIFGDSLVVIPAVAARWKPPLSMIGQYKANLRRLRIGFDAGASDGLADIPVNVRALDSTLTRLGVPHFAEVYEGTHGNRIRERLERVVFPFFSRYLNQSAVRVALPASVSDVANPFLSITPQSFLPRRNFHRPRSLQ
jgi:S-formylglutathione hydrolase FrmB